MKMPSASAWGLRLLALILAIMIYHALKTETSHSGTTDDRTLFHND